MEGGDFMKFRKKQSGRGARRSFRRGAKVKRKNYATAQRGGYRL